MERNRTWLRDGRIVVLARGSKTQTINVCTSDNKDGKYEHIYRLPITEDVELADIAELADAAAVHDWVPTRNGVEEQRDGQGGQAVLPLVDVDIDLDQVWLAAATAAVEIVLDDVVIEFLEHPYLHRVEHSLHAEIYRRLKDQPALQGQFPIATGELTQVAHKEWPETFPDRSVGATQRGSFDLAVVSPQQFASASRQKFRQGRIAAPVVVEVGLDYGWSIFKPTGRRCSTATSEPPTSCIFPGWAAWTWTRSRLTPWRLLDIFASPTCTTIRAVVRGTSGWVTAR